MDSNGPVFGSVWGGGVDVRGTALFSLSKSEVSTERGLQKSSPCLSCDSRKKPDPRLDDGSSAQ